MKYIDYKTTIWQRLYFTDETDMQEKIKKLEKDYLPFDLAEAGEGFIENEILYDTQEFITAEENDGQSTIEVFETRDDEYFQECIWDNSLNQK